MSFFDILKQINPTGIGSDIPQEAVQSKYESLRPDDLAYVSNAELGNAFNNATLRMIHGPQYDSYIGMPPIETATPREISPKGLTDADFAVANLAQAVDYANENPSYRASRNVADEEYATRRLLELAGLNNLYRPPAPNYDPTNPNNSKTSRR